MGGMARLEPEDKVRHKEVDGDEAGHKEEGEGISMI
jgi:hypothetical protein